jgi:hypothetical protein
MRKLIMWNLQTLDGCFEGARPWDLEFHDTAWGEELQSLRRSGLFDEYRICIAPIVLGNGAPLFKPGTEASRLTLLDSRTLATEALILRYAPAE